MASKTKGGGKSGHSSDHHHDHEHERIEEPLDEQELEALYAWVDSIPLSRPKRNISRDFSDGVLVAECVRHFFPDEGIVDLHNYTAANATNKKKENWYYLNRKVFSKMNFELAEDVINDLCCCKGGMIEKVLLMLQVKIKRAEYARARNSDKPEADQHQMTPGRKDGKMVKVGIEDTKGSRFLKTKQENDSEFEPKKKVKFKDAKDNTDKTGLRLQEQKPQTKTPAKYATIPKKRIGPVVESDMVPRYVVEEKEQEVLSRDETIQILRAKAQKMEHLLQLKEMRIAELSNSTAQVGYSDTGYSNGHSNTQLHSHKPMAQRRGVHQAAQAYGDGYGVPQADNNPRYRKPVIYNYRR